MISFENTKVYDPLYKRGVKGEVRVWRMELGYNDDGVSAHRVLSGILDGAMTETGWSFTEPKNIGKKNATTAHTQALAEIENQYQIKLERGYFRDMSKIDEVPFTKPMLAQDWDKRKAKVDVSKGVHAQPKLDGIRCIARADGLWTRTGKPITAVPHIVDMLAPLFERDPDLELDGELYNHELRDDFNTITSVVRKEKPSPAEIEQARSLIQYHVYDMPSHPGRFSERASALYALLEGDGGPFFDEKWHGIYVVETVYVTSTDTLDELYAKWMGDGYEGQMIRLDEVYENKRSNFLMKRKDFVTEEFRVIRMEPGNGNWAGAIKRFIVECPTAEDGECDATPRGSYEKMAALLASGNTPDWATVRFFGRTPDGKLRFPVAVDYGYGARVD